MEQLAGITPSVARLTEALDAERLSVASAYNVFVPSLVEHYHRIYGFDDGTTLANMVDELNKKRKGLPKGPTSTTTRYITEDVPFGLTFIEHLAEKKGLHVPVHAATIDMFNALYGCILEKKMNS